VQETQQDRLHKTTGLICDASEFRYTGNERLYIKMKRNAIHAAIVQKHPQHSHLSFTCAHTIRSQALRSPPSAILVYMASGDPPVIFVFETNGDDQFGIVRIVMRFVPLASLDLCLRDDRILDHCKQVCS
jgi:hypothetical protein